jgi:DNA-binding NtrC family response regulator
MSPPRTVLLVEDHGKTRSLLARLLKTIGFESVHEASNARDAMAMLARYPVDLVVSDHHMDDIDGLQLRARMQDSADFCDIPFILVSADDDIRLINQAAEAGLDMLIKPFHGDRLLDAAQRAVGRIHWSTPQSG